MCVCLTCTVSELLIMNYKKTKNDWIRTSECLEVFEKIKEVLTLDLFIIHYNPDLEIIVTSDTSLYGIGACILHKIENGSLKPIANASCTLLYKEKKTFRSRKKSLETIFVVTKFHRYIHGRQITNHNLRSMVQKTDTLILQAGC